MTIAASPISQRSYADVWLITLGHVFTHWYPATFYLLLPLIGNELGLSYAQIGSILTAQFAFGAISNIPGGLLVDSVGRKGLLMGISLFWIGIPYLLMGFSNAYWLLLACAALVGMGNNLWHPTAIPLLGNRYPDRRGLVMSLHSMGGNLGDAVAPLVAGVLLAFFSWRGVVIMNVLPGMLMALVILVYYGRPQAGDELAPSQRVATSAADMLRMVRTLLSNRTVTMLSVSSAFRTMTQTALLTFLPVYLANQMGYSVFWIGASMFALQAAGFAAAPIAGHLSDRLGRRQIIVSSMLMSAVVLLFMAFAGRSSAFVFFIALLGFFLFAIRAVLQAWLLDATPREMGGTSIGILFGTQAVGAAIGPLVGGLIADSYGLIATFYFLAFTVVVANLFVFFTPIPERKPARERPSEGTNGAGEGQVAAR
jgi:FSR family fosmidomycin resistance protein-like MFS transporter